MAKRKAAQKSESSYSVEYFAENIKEAWGKQVQSFIAVGQWLIKAKAELDHGDFTDMITKTLRLFSLRTAERYMEIAAHPVLSNPTHVSVLPPRWGTLYEIAVADIPQDRLEELLANGTIHADSEREQVKKIIKNNITGYEQGLQAIGVLIEFSKKYPEPSERDTLVDLIMDLEEQRDEKYDFSLDELEDLGAWIGKLRLACQTELDRYKAEHPEEFWETRSLFDTPVKKQAQTPEPEEEAQTPEEVLAEA